MEKILVVGPSWVGDMVMAQTLFKLLQQRYPHSQIDVLAPAWSHPILARMPEVTQAITLPLGHGQLGLKSRWQLGRQLKQEGYTQAIVLPRSWKSALVPFAAGIPRRIGFHGEQRYILLNHRRRLDKKQLDQTVKRFAALGLDSNEAITTMPLPAPALRIDSAQQQRLQQEFGLDQQLPAIAMMPGAEYGPAKQWPLSSFQKLAEELVAAGYQVWILGGPKDRAAGEVIAQSQHPSIVNLCGRTQLADVVDLLALAEQAVTNDSGLMHVAAAVGTRVHAIYGSSSAAFTPPLTENKVIHSLNLDCSPCFKRECPLGHTRCLKDLHLGVKELTHAGRA
ncbi:lipopolysaccharide heptosyltransferase II [Marinospirillum sp.]|uniref:lipopolysaccharide heptosyltransferase II n=1 Tax=Marinospirillum sp. TaxID=2183934 RepID=UPI003A89780F